jgi:hypothetical protein
MYKPWLSRLLDESAFPMLALAVAVSQVKLELHNKDAVHDRGQPASEVRSDDRFQPNAEKMAGTLQRARRRIKNPPTTISTLWRSSSFSGAFLVFLLGIAAWSAADR